ncbi:MAG: transglutaminase domain-containing protein [Campylobacteraceae bacterium]|nr:transglutaminase domain-containing protein [Campylobacteraceae bacterium]
MNRREFLTSSALLAGGATLAPSVVLGGDKAIAPVIKHRFFEVTLTHKILEKGDVAKLWLPLPLTSEYQSLISKIENSGNYDEIYMSDFDIPTLYAKFSKEERNITTKFSVATIERNTDFSKVNFNENEKLSPEIAKYLEATKTIQTDGAVKEKADEITKGIKGDLERARAIYDWVANTMERDESVVGCGVGDAKKILESGKLVGKCTDINSVFVALCRSAGIPAREFFGIRLGESRFSGAMGSGKEGKATITGSQHCRAEFYLKGYGWIPVDPADVTKVRLAEKLTNDDAKIVQVRDYLFGNWEMCWMAFNAGRDFILKPTPEIKPLNNFGYPYAEVDGHVQNYYDPKGFSYEYKSIEL